MKKTFRLGAMFARLEESDVIESVPVKFGVGVLHPGEFVTRLGERCE